MATEYGNLIIFPLFILLMTISTTVSGTAVLTLVHEETSVDYTNSFEFTETQFSEFYDCLCEQTSTKCNFEYDTDKTLNRPVLQLDTISDATIDPKFSNYFTCKNNALMSVVNCTRLSQDEISCNGVMRFTSVPRPKAATCETECAGMRWFSYQKELLVYNSVAQSKSPCQSDCFKPLLKTTTPEPTTTPIFVPSSPKIPSTQTTTSAPTSSSPPPTTTTTNVITEMTTSLSSSTTETTPSLNSTKVTKAKLPADDNDDNDSLPLIIGTVVGALLVVVLITVIVVVVCRRRKRRDKPSRQRSSARDYPYYARQTSNLSDRSRNSAFCY